MEQNIIPKASDVVAGSEHIEGADNNENLPDKMCVHEFSLEKTILHKESFYGKEELLTSIVFCKKCGRLGGSSLIKF